MASEQDAAGRTRLRVSSDLLGRLFQPVDIASLIYFRIVFGAMMLWELWSYYARGWLKSNWIDPTFYFAYPGFEWVRAWPSDGMYWHFLALGVFSLFIVLGFLYRFAALGFFIGFTYVFLIDQTQYVNHLYLISLLSLLLTFVPANRSFSIDARLRPSLRSDTAPAWTLWLIRAQLGLAYFYAGVAKLNWDWLHGWPMRSTLAVRHDHPIIGLFSASEWAVYFLSYGGLIFDLVVVPLLLWRKTRLFAFIVACCFHLTNAMIFNIGVFPWLMIALTAMFFPPDWPRRLLRMAPRTPPPSPMPTGSWTSGQRATVTMLAIYLGIQLLVPLRHYLHPGDASWTEEGHHFAWRLMLRKKLADYRFTRVYVAEAAGGRAWLDDPRRYFPNWYEERMHLNQARIQELRRRIARDWEERGHAGVRVIVQNLPINFTVTDPESNQTFFVDLNRYLTRRQIRKMSTRPDLIRQFSHHLAKEKRDQGYEQVQVRAEVWVSMHQREFQLLVDPDVDLAAQPYSLSSASWIMPLVKPLPDPAEVSGD